jgi:hypothetical protein
MNQAKAIISFQKKMSNPFLFKLFLFLKLPMAFLAGIKLKELSDNRAVLQMKYKYLNKNPFGSIYFACLSMAGELASGMLAASIAFTSHPNLSMLVVGVKINFTKKAVGTILFECNQGKEISSTIQKCILTGESQTIDTFTVAKNEEGVVVADFLIKWSFRAKAKG